MVVIGRYSDFYIMFSARYSSLTVAEESIRRFAVFSQAPFCHFDNVLQFSNSKNRLVDATKGPKQVGRVILKDFMLTCQDSLDHNCEQNGVSRRRYLEISSSPPLPDLLALR